MRFGALINERRTANEDNCWGPWIVGWGLMDLDDGAGLWSVDGIIVDYAVTHNVAHTKLEAV